MKPKLSCSTVAALAFVAWFGLAAAANAADSHLADAHAVRKISCERCHGTSDPMALPALESLERVNASCVSCHGDLAKLAAITKPKLANKYINPHASHLVQIDCITCHRGHDQGQSYCLQCHDFNMPMPSAGQAKKQ
jgi:fumarate reductase flavoprotein subunit